MLREYLFVPLILGLMTASTIIQAEEADSSLSDSACSFTVELLKNAIERDVDNVVMSPISVGAVLALLQQGAQGTTAEQLEKVLNLSSEKSKEVFSTLATFMKDDQRKVTLEWANSIYLRDDFVLNGEYEKIVKENFRSIIEQKNFTYPSKEETAENINKWISDVTHGEINNLLQPSMINADTMMILINAIYFKGIWASKFEHARTRISDFHLNAERTEQSLFMRQEERFPAGEDPTLGIKWVELPYEDPKFSMLFILPNENDGLQKVIDTLTSADLKRFIANEGTRYVKLGIPKFKLDWKSSLVQLLTKMGLTDMFSPNANLAGISQSNQALTVSDVVHQANLEIDEDGTVASAATLEFVQVLSLIVHNDDMVFYADHPFLAFIIDKQNNIPLFAAKIGDPTSGKPPSTTSSGASIDLSQLTNN